MHNSQNFICVPGTDTLDPPDCHPHLFFMLFFKASHNQMLLGSHTFPQVQGVALINLNQQAIIPY